ncbi:MAG: hypothetical protein M1817_005493 [Caeruleum heppii]|nr:MAG: hypothetical protein M1817_005493 [Caeruleum heppii]
MGLTRLSLLAVFASMFAPWAIAVQPIEVRGSEFINTVTGARLQIVGIDYQPGGQSGYDPGSRRDPLSDGEVCLRDAALMQRLGVNALRVYNLDPTINHDLCASIFNSVGIYMLLDVNSPLGGESINRGDPASSYHSGYLNRIFGVVEAFKGYPNTLAFFGGNEVINDVGSAEIIPPYLRAVQRDLKDYIAKHSDRAIPVGYSAADVREILADTWKYLDCAIEGEGNDQSKADFFALNSYSWCGSAANYETAGYDVLVSQFSNTTIPVFFSEYGCNEVLPRTFEEVQAIYGPQMTAVLSGGMVYEFSQEPSNYGLVDVSNDGSVRLRVDYDNLQQQYSKLDFQLLGSADASATSRTPAQCDSSLITADGFNSSFEIPSIPEGGQDLIDNGIEDPNRGQLVSVPDTQVRQTVQDSQGNTITNLAISPLPEDQSNTPGAAPSSSGTAPSPTPSKKGAAMSQHDVSSWLLVCSLSLGLLLAS